MKLIQKFRQIFEIKVASLRENAIEELGDLFEYEINYSNQELQEAMGFLLNYIYHENNNTIQESILNIIDILLVQRDISSNIDFDEFVTKINHLEFNCLEYAINFLGYSRNKKYKSIVESYLTHEDNLIVQAAKNALQYFS